MSYNQEMLESRQLFDYIKVGKEATINVAVILADNKHNEFSTQTNQIQQNNKLKDEMICLINLEKQLNNCINASIKTDEQIRQMMNDSEDDENKSIINANVSQIFDEKLLQISAQNNSVIEDDEKYKQLMEILSEITNDSQEDNRNDDENEEELVAIESEEQRIPIDPFSKTEIVNPVKNKKCHHIYDKEQLRLVLLSKSSGKLRCPFVGCNNRSVTMDDVCDDRRTKAMIDNIRRKLNN